MCIRDRLWAGDNVYADIRHKCLDLIINSHPECPSGQCSRWHRLTRCFQQLSQHSRLFLPADTERLEAQYEWLMHRSGFGSKLLPELELANATVLGTWDDHDYGTNDGDQWYENKKESQRAFLDMMRVPAGSPRRMREGVYHQETLYSERDQKSVSVILLDGRYHKSDTDFLGEQQWQWLHGALEQSSTADLTLIVSGIQVLSSSRLKHEKWHDFPASRRRLLEMILSSNATAPVILSGDVHFGELNQVNCISSGGVMVQLPEVTSSGLTHAVAGEVGAYPWFMSWPVRVYLWMMPRVHDVSGQFLGANVGELEMDWEKQSLTARVISYTGEVALWHSWNLRELGGVDRAGREWVCTPYWGERRWAVMATNMLSLALVGVVALGPVGWLVWAAVSKVPWRLLGGNRDGKSKHKAP
eukprot:TRINITY_DN6860_c0_g1_i4.p1 TRINITY_DN6860_c0_g1~~TRINITY_DN6860_c0_g1_i4.p1  ORF type:complete len:415 (+),score=75.44 TRINITY_DN6860_c0_g1_i4:126-1370(+)